MSNTPTLIEPKPRVATWRSRQWMPGVLGYLTRDLLALFASTAFFEVTGNIVYVMLMERAYLLGGGAASVGIFLILQAGAQLALGSIVGSYADNLGARRAGILGLIAQAMLALGLAFTQSILWIYLIAFLLTVARLFVITSRLPLLSQLTQRTSYVRSNVVVYLLNGFGLFLGPTIAAALYLIWRDPLLPFVVASGLFTLAVIPLLFLTQKSLPPTESPVPSLLEVVRIGWRHITVNRCIWEVLICLGISSIMFGTFVPTLTLLAKQVGLGTEGSGVMVGAIGIGWMFGPLSAPILIRRLGYTKSLLLTGLITPSAVLAIGFITSVGGILLGIVLAAFAGAGLNVIVISIVQRLTPSDIQGSVIGSQVALSGLLWIFSAASITGLLTLPQFQTDPRGLYYPIGILGILLTLVCWIGGRENLEERLAWLKGPTR